MKAITIDNAEAGMKLAQDVISSNGQTLAKSGLVLDDYYVDILKKYNVDVIIIAGENESREMSIEERSALLQQIRPKKLQIFGKCLSDRMMYEMYEIIVQMTLWEKWNNEE
ncbi:MAG TPA: hypothetical protein PL063_00185 [Candidatus Cloacimonadota bacterium]|nr:hypothetical protein [Candidatus Cloacimonadota bacterium]HQB40176.1 hypothetical protein [Candidatus Cloacimonadota bacterium]